LCIVAGDLERWTEPTAEQRYLYGRVPSFGLARDAELMRQGVAPVIPRPERTRRPQRERGPFLTYLRLPWSYGDRSPGDLWHRMQCRRGHHEVIGGHTMQLGSTVVYVERRCRWCDAEIGAG
jgi:hypothetical protein